MRPLTNSAPLAAPARRPFFLVPLFLLAASLAYAQTTYTVSGTVTSALDNHPIQRATVELLATETYNVVQTVTADELGHFTFSAVPKGAFALRGETPGFLQSLFQQHGAFSTAVVTGASVPTQGLTLALQPLGRISGTVTDEFSEPVRNATVHLYRRDDSAGDNRLVSTGQLQTDDLGHYELARLAPGTYFVAVTASPWYAIHPGGATLPPLMTVVPYRDPTLDVAYPVTYFPAGYDAAHAAPLEVQGNQVRADIQLTPVPAVSLTFPRDTAAPNSPMPQLEASVFGHPTFAPMQSQQTPDGIVISGLAPGDYTLHTNITVPIPGSQGFRYQPGPSTPLHLTRDAPAALPLPSSSGVATVHITVRSSDGEALPPSLQVRLMRADNSTDLQPRPTGPPARPHQFDLESDPGDFFLALAGAPAFFIREVSIAGKSLPSNDLHLAPGDSLTGVVTVSRGTHTLRGFVQRDGQPASGAMLLLIPADQHLPPRTWYRQQSDLDGSFTLPALPPGPYLLLALDESAWHLDWRSISFLSRNLPHATPVLIPEKPPLEVDLPRPVAIQTL